MFYCGSKVSLYCYTAFCLALIQDELKCKQRRQGKPVKSCPPPCFSDALRLSSAQVLLFSLTYQSRMIAIIPLMVLIQSNSVLFKLLNTIAFLFDLVTNDLPETAPSKTAILHHHEGQKEQSIMATLWQQRCFL